LSFFLTSKVDGHALSATAREQASGGLANVAHSNKGHAARQIRPVHSVLRNDSAKNNHKQKKKKEAHTWLLTEPATA
jgi:hypothetical protein